MAKRVFDCVVAGGCLVLLSPVFLGLALLVKSTSPGPVLYRAVRIGKDGQTFVMYKFRSMWAGGPFGPRITRAGDPRITPVGQILRRNKLDELPQLWNVLKGEMSMVGSRPQDPRYFAHYTAEQRRVFDNSPGLVSAANVAYLREEELLERSGESLEEYYLNVVMPDKLRLDLDYLARRTFFTDLGLLWRAGFGVLRRTILGAWAACSASLW